jgi:UMF1 family MFS transporter
MGLTLQQLLILGLLANISGAIGCYLFGFFIKNDKLTVIVTLTILILLILALSINTSQILFIILVIIATFFTGPLQSSSRVIMANLTDDNRQGFSFGIFTLSGKITAFVGPICAALLTFLISQRIGFAFSIVLLSLGLLLMTNVSYNKKIKNLIL